MPRVYTCLLALSAAVAAANAQAGPEITARAEMPVAKRGLSTCSNNACGGAESCPYLSISYSDSTTTIAGCCLGSDASGQKPINSVCEGWPICKGPTTTTWEETPVSCAALVAYTAANYDAELSLAEAAFSADPSSFCFTVGSNSYTDNCAAVGHGGGGGAAATPTTTTTVKATASTSIDGDTNASSSGGDAGATAGDANGAPGSAVNSGTSGGSSHVATVVSGTAAEGTTLVSSTGSTSSSSSASTTANGTSGASALSVSMGWGAWAMGVVGVLPAVMALML
ncbi:unnamed protein product [Discula destructiva]